MKNRRILAVPRCYTILYIYMSHIIWIYDVFVSWAGPFFLIQTDKCMLKKIRSSLIGSRLTKFLGFGSKPWSDPQKNNSDPIKKYIQLFSFNFFIILYLDFQIGSLTYSGHYPSKKLFLCTSKTSWTYSTRYQHKRSLFPAMILHFHNNL